MATFLVVVLFLLYPVSDRLYVVLTDSMSPTLQAGDAILIQPVSTPPEIGSIVSYDIQGKLITHRVVDIEGNTLTTKGDANQESDPWTVPISSVVGMPRVRIPYLGHVIVLIRRPIGWLVLVVLPAGVIISDEIRKIAATLRAAQQKKM